jgi:hypothetical protein
MGREVRRVPKDWKHPRKDNGNYQPLFEGGYMQKLKDWNKGKKKWDEGLVEDWGGGKDAWKDKSEDLKNMTYSEWNNPAPEKEHYMPDFKEEEKTHIQMYEDTSEGTPISPVLETPEELARWLADNKASAFAGRSATYEQWLATIDRGSAPSAIVSNGVVKSGVEASENLK